MLGSVKRVQHTSHAPRAPWSPTWWRWWVPLDQASWGRRGGFLLKRTNVYTPLTNIYSSAEVASSFRTSFKKTQFIPVLWKTSNSNMLGWNWTTKTCIGLFWFEVSKTVAQTANRCNWDRNGKRAVFERELLFNYRTREDRKSIHSG